MDENINENITMDGENGFTMTSGKTEETNSNAMPRKKIKLPAFSKGFKIFAILTVICIAAGILPFFVNSPKIFTGKVSINSNVFNDFDDISDFKNLKKTFKNVKIGGKNSDYISKVYIEGVIQKKNKTYDQEKLLKLIKNLQNDENNKGIILYVNSPGGTVFDSDNVYLELEKYKKSGKLVHAYFAQIAASGAYYISCSATTISANRNSLIGSIGVICGQFTDATELLAKIGIKSKTITSGKNKNMMNFNEPATPEQVSIMQSLADDAYEQFTGIVAKSRNMSKAQVLEIADGRIYSARQSLENGLIDNICSYEAAENMLKKDLNNMEIEVHDEKFEEKPSVYEMLTNAKAVISEACSFLKTGTISSLHGPAYYYPL